MILDSQLLRGHFRLLDVRRIAICLFLLVLFGCGGDRNRVVGTWKGTLQPGKPSNTLEGGLGAMASAMTGEITLEFTGSGKVKTSMGLGSGVGDYTVAGNEVTITGTEKDGKPTKLVIEGDTLRSRKDFDSDPAFVFHRVSSGDPGAKN